MGIFAAVARGIKAASKGISKVLKSDINAADKIQKSRNRYTNKAQKLMRETKRRTFTGEDEEQRKTWFERQKDALHDVLTRNKAAKISPEEQAQFIINKTNVGQRIIGGTVDIWRDAAIEYNEYGYGTINQDKIIPALQDYFNVNSYEELLNVFEKSIGVELYSPDVDSLVYDKVRLLIQSKLADGSFVY